MKDETRNTKHETRAAKRWWSALALIGLVLSILWLARGAVLAAPTQATTPSIRFVPVDVMLDSGTRNLAAYQVEITAGADTKIVGLEGGQHAAFRDAPYYDPDALQGNRIIVAAFSTADALPSGQTRVARLHLAVIGGAANELPQLIGKLVVATDASGQSIPTRVALQATQGDKP